MRYLAPRAVGLTLLAGLLMLVWTAAGQPDCPAARLRVGGQGTVLPGDPNRVRAEASTGAEQVGVILGGATFDVLDGPVCGEGYRWWLVQRADVTGWTVEGDVDAYFVEPVATRDSVDPTGLVWSPDGTRLIVGAEQGNLVFDTADWEAPARWIGRGAQALAIRPPDPDTLIAAPAEPYDGYILSLYDLATGDLIYRLAYGGETTQPPVTALAAAGNRFIHIIDNYAYETRDGVRINAISMPGGADAIDVITSPDGIFAAFLYDDVESGTVQVGLRSLTTARTEVEPGGLIDPLEIPPGAVSAAFNPAGETLAVGDSIGVVSIWTVPDARNTAVVTVLGDSVIALSFSVDGDRLAALSTEGLVIADAESLEVVETLDVAGAMDAAYSPDGMWLAILTGRELIIVEVDGYTEAYRLPLNDL